MAALAVSVALLALGATLPFAAFAAAARAPARAAASSLPSHPQENDASPASTHYTRTLGPYSLDGAQFTVKLSVICYKSTSHAGPCSEDDEETVKSMQIDDALGKPCFRTSFP